MRRERPLTASLPAAICAGAVASLRSRSNCITRAGKPERLRHKEEFLAAVAEELDDIGPIDFHPGSTLSGVYVTPESQVRIGLVWGFFCQGDFPSGLGI